MRVAKYVHERRIMTAVPGVHQETRAVGPFKCFRKAVNSTGQVETRQCDDIRLRDDPTEPAAQFRRIEALGPTIEDDGAPHHVLDLRVESGGSLFCYEQFAPP
jgi:hypothetical protein